MFVVGRKTKSFGGQNVCTFQEIFLSGKNIQVFYPETVVSCHSEDKSNMRF